MSEQKKLTTNEMLNLTEEKAWEIAGDFSFYLEKRKQQGLYFWGVCLLK